MRLLQHAPYAVRAPLPPPEDAVCVQPLGRLDERGKAKVITTSAQLQRLEGAPCVRASLPQKTLLALPQLAALPMRDGFDLAQLKCDSTNSDEEIDVGQLDSPHSRRQLAAAGVDDPTTASPSRLKRAFNYIFGTSESQPAKRAAPPPPPPPAAIPSPPLALPLPPSAPPPPSSQMLALNAPTSLPCKRNMGDRNAEHKAAKKESESNPWFCTCLSVWPTRGRKWHQPGCAREIFRRAGGAAAGATMPTLGETVTCLQCAGPRKGHTYRCIKVGPADVRGWERVADDV